MDKPFHSVASDYQRVAMIHVAMRRACEIARESFYHGLIADHLGDSELTLFAEDAWERFSNTVIFDYPAYAHELFKRAYRVAYQAFSENLPHGIHPDTSSLAEKLEDEIHQAHGHL